MEIEPEFPSFVPLPKLQARRAAKSGTKLQSPERSMVDFKLEGVTFRYGVDFVDGNERLRWTPAGIDKLIAARLWTREFDQRGNLKTKPPTPHAAMKLPGAHVARP